MNPTRLFPLLTLITLLSPRPASAQDRALESLYSKRFSMDSAGVPLVKIGIKEGLSTVTVSSSSGFTVTHGESALKIKGLNRVSVSLLKSRPAKVRYWVSLKSVGIKSKGEQRRARKELKGIRYTPIEQGFVIALGGKVLDTRRILYSLGPFKSYRAARKKQRKLAKRRKGVFVHAQLVSLPSGSLIGTSPKGVRFTGTAVLTFAPTGRGSITIHDGTSQHAFPGIVHAAIGRDGKLAMVNEIPLETYLRGILPSELFPSAPLEALKAQAVAARGQVLAKMGIRHHADPFHLCAKVHCQVYQGLHKVYKRTNMAVNKTKGLVLFDKKGLPADTVYHSSSGGHTENNELVWGGEPKSYLRGRPDGVRWRYSSEPSLLAFLKNGKGAFCKNGNRGFRWRRLLGPKRLRRLLKKHGIRGKVKSIRVLRRGVSGRAISLSLRTTRTRKVILGELAIRRLFGGLRSSMFVVRRTKGGFTFLGGGYGHGVGMSQWGAINRAKAGQSFRKILSFYYRGTLLKKMY